MKSVSFNKNLCSAQGNTSRFVGMNVTSPGIERVTVWTKGNTGKIV